MFSSIMKSIIAVLIALAAIITVDIGLPNKPVGEKLDLSQFTLVWEDEFEGDTIDTEKWNNNQNVGGLHWGPIRRGGYWHKDMAFVNDGSLKIRTQYFDEGKDPENGYDAGYYSAQVTTKGKFQQLYGYFEVSCKLPPAQGLWAAFWMMNDDVFNVDGSGEDGTEIDIFESFYYKDSWWGAGDAVSINLHYDGYDENHQGKKLGLYNIENPYDTFNTYGVEWNEDEYIFYINGVECVRSDFGGVSKNAEYMILSVEVGGENGVAAGTRNGCGVIAKTPEENWPVDFEIDYVRAYQYNHLLES